MLFLDELTVSARDALRAWWQPPSEDGRVQVDQEPRACRVPREIHAGRRGQPVPVWVRTAINASTAGVGSTVSSPPPEAVNPSAARPHRPPSGWCLVSPNRELLGSGARRSDAAVLGVGACRRPGERQGHRQTQGRSASRATHIYWDRFVRRHVHTFTSPRPRSCCCRRRWRPSRPHGARVRSGAEGRQNRRGPRWGPAR